MDKFVYDILVIIFLLLMKVGVFMNWYQRIIESERFGPSPYAKYYAKDSPGPKRKPLYSDNFSQIYKELQKEYDIKWDIVDPRIEYKLTVDNLLTIDYIVDCREHIIYGDGYIDEECIILRRIEIKDDKKRGQGFGTKFMKDLFEATERLYANTCYILFPYMNPNDEEYNVRIGRWYINKLGFKPLRSSTKFIQVPHVRMYNEDNYQKGIRPLGWSCKWDRYAGLKRFIAKEEEYTALQRKYFEKIEKN